MKKNHKHDEYDNQEHDVELLKAVAQAWHGHLSSSKTTSEFDAYRQYFKGKPTRFKIEAMNVTMNVKDQWNGSWDFSKSLWDSYEIVNVSKKLERGLMLDNPFLVLDDKEMVAAKKKRKESKHSLRSLLKVSSKRFTEDDLPSKASS